VIGPLISSSLMSPSPPKAVIVTDADTPLMETSLSTPTLVSVTPLMSSPEMLMSLRGAALVSVPSTVTLPSRLSTKKSKPSDPLGFVMLRSPDPP